MAAPCALAPTSDSVPTTKPQPKDSCPDTDTNNPDTNSDTDHDPDSKPSPLLSLLLEIRSCPNHSSTPDAFAALSAPYLDTPPTDPLSDLIPPLFDLMLRHPSHVVLQVAATHILSTISHSSPQAARTVADSKGIQLLVHTMLFHTQSFSVSFNAVRALAALVPAAPELVPALIRLFGVEVVVAAGKTFLKHEDFQKVALAVLTLMAEGDHTTDVAAALRRGCHVRAAIRAMKFHRSNAEIALEACHLIGQVAKRADKGTMKQIGRLGAIRMLCLAIVALKDDEDVQYSAFRALSTLVARDEFCAAQLGSMRGIEIVLRSMRKFRNSAELRINCLILLDTMVALDEMQAMVVFTMGGLEAIVSSMIEFRHNLEVQLYAIRILDRIVWCQEVARLKLLSDGSLKTISTSLRTHITNEALVERGVKLLRHIRYSK